MQKVYQELHVHVPQCEGVRHVKPLKIVNTKPQWTVRVSYHNVLVAKHYVGLHVWQCTENEKLDHMAQSSIKTLHKIGFR